MRRLAAVSIVVLMVAGIALQLFATPRDDSPSAAASESSPSVKGAVFLSGLDTSVGVPEYPMVSRALMLPSGATDATLADIDGDGLTDLIVAVYSTKNVSVFYGQADGTFLTYPSYNVTLAGLPLQVKAVDIFGTGRVQLVVLERKATSLDLDHLEIFNYTSRSNYLRIMDRPPPIANASKFVVGSLNGDRWPDFAVACSGMEPVHDIGRIEIAYGPLYSSWVTLQAGHGANSLAGGDYNNDGKTDLAIANIHDSDVLVYYQPFSDFMLANLNISAPGGPVSLASGKLTTGDFDDLIALTENPSRIRFYQQSLVGSDYSLPSSESFGRPIEHPSSSISINELDGDSLDDVVVLSESWSVAYGFCQRAGAAWPSGPDFVLPTQEGPKSVLASDLDGDLNIDLAVMSAKPDWSGSSLGLYPSHLISGHASFSNSNETIWGNSTYEPSAVATGDLNGDGVEDVVVSYPDASSIAYSLSGSQPWQYVSLGGRLGKMILSDVNGDGFDDIVVARPLMSDVRIAFGQGSLPGTIRQASISCSAQVRDIALGHLNMDSMPDLAVATDNNELQLFYNTGDLQTPFSYVESFTNVNATSLAIADLNDDALPDLAFTNGSSSAARVEILLQKTMGPTISPPSDLTLSASVSSAFSGLAVADVTGDGLADVEAWIRGDDRVFMFDQTSFGTGPYRVLTLPEPPNVVALVDATDDGLADMLVSYASADLLFLHKQDGTGLHEAPSMVFVTGGAPDFAAVGDATGDGRGDLIVSSAASHCLSIWEQLNFPPVAHAGGPYFGVEGSPLTLSGRADTGYSEIQFTTYRWQFGDGAGTGWVGSPIASHNYLDEGTYLATLEVMDPAGLTDSNSTLVHITDSTPRVNFTWAPPSPLEGQTIVFTDTSVWYDAIVQTNWTIRDSGGRTVASGSDSTMSAVLDNDTYMVTLELTDNDSSVNMTSKQVVVLRSGPTLTIRAPMVAREHTTVDFTCDVDAWHSGLGDTVVSFEWNFSYSGGAFHPQEYGGTSNATSHSFDSPGVLTNYTVAVRATDDDGDTSLGFFNITILDVTTVTVQATSAEPRWEWHQVNFSASVDSAWSPVSYAWDFESSLASFSADLTTTASSANHTYQKAGTYIVRVSVSMSNGSSAMSVPLLISISDVLLTIDDSDLVTTKDPADTSKVSFDATALDRYPDIARTVWNFGDGTVLDLYGGPSEVKVHGYVPDASYTANITFTDDEGHSKSIIRVLRMSEPVIDLRSPIGDTVVRKGVPVRFTVADDSPPLIWVRYSVDGGAFINFSIQYEIDTSDWSEGAHSVEVRAQDQDGNVAGSGTISITIDDVAPVVVVHAVSESVYGGSRLNISVSVSDPNIGPVTLYVKFPGDDAFQPFAMVASGSTYYRVVEVPAREGQMSFYVNATDLASNPTVTSVQSVEIKLHLMDVIWPYLLALTVLAALGTGAYFMRESKIAVDEAFVIYNDGRLISHSTRRLKPGMDDQVLSGMFVAIQDFVKDSFKDVTSFTLRKLEFGEKSVLIEKGDHLFLAVILHGKASKKVAHRMQEVVDEIEEIFSPHLRDWDGDLDKVRGVSDLVKKLYSRAPMLPGPFRRSGE